MLVLGKTGWPGEYQDCASYGACHCEAFHEDDWVLQPTNTATNYFFVFFGLLMLYKLARDPPCDKPTMTGDDCPRNYNYFIGNNVFSVTFAAVSIFTGLSSAYFHASMRAWGNILDVVGMYLFISFIPIYTIAKMTKKPEKWFIIVYFSLNILFAGVRVFIFQTHLRLLIFYIFLGLTVIVELYIYGVRKFNWKKPEWFPSVNRDVKYVLLALATFIIGYIIWNLWQDGGPLCDPDSWFQGHGVWHFACAVAEWFVFLYLRSEKVHDPNAIQERIEKMDC